MRSPEKAHQRFPDLCDALRSGDAKTAEERYKTLRKAHDFMLSRKMGNNVLFRKFIAAAAHCVIDVAEVLSSSPSPGTLPPSLRSAIAGGLVAWSGRWTTDTLENADSIDEQLVLRVMKAWVVVLCTACRWDDKEVVMIAKEVVVYMAMPAIIHLFENINYCISTILWLGRPEPLRHLADVMEVKSLRFLLAGLWRQFAATEDADQMSEDLGMRVILVSSCRTMIAILKREDDLGSRRSTRSLDETGKLMFEQVQRTRDDDTSFMIDATLTHVFGLPPLLSRTTRSSSEQTDDDDNDERRRRSRQKLKETYAHFEATGSTATRGGDRGDKPALCPCDLAIADLELILESSSRSASARLPSFVLHALHVIGEAFDVSMPPDDKILSPSSTTTTLEKNSSSAAVSSSVVERMIDALMKRRRTCAGCDRLHYYVRRCGGCMKVAYCSEQCQRSNWIGGKCHSTECRRDV